MKTDTAPARWSPVAILVGAWFVLALAVGASGLLRSARPPLPPVLIVLLTASLLVLFWQWPALHGWASTVDIRALILIHVSRFVGAYFLVLHARGELPYAFAVPGGWGDIAVATAALVIGLPSLSQGRWGWPIVFAWNTAGLVDILLVVTTAARLGSADPQSMAALFRLPLSLLPTFLVPIIIATHIVIFARLSGWRRWARNVRRDHGRPGPRWAGDRNR